MSDGAGDLERPSEQLSIRWMLRAVAAAGVATAAGSIVVLLVLLVSSPPSIECDSSCPDQSLANTAASIALGAVLVIACCGAVAATRGPAKRALSGWRVVAAGLSLAASVVLGALAGSAFADLVLSPLLGARAPSRPLVYLCFVALACLIWARVATLLVRRRMARIEAAEDAGR